MKTLFKAILAFVAVLSVVSIIQDGKYIRHSIAAILFFTLAFWEPRK